MAIERLTLTLLAVAFLFGPGGCESTPADPSVEVVEIDGRRFTLELALDGPSRTLGLGGRESIADDGGMLFVFPRADRRSFVMRDCLTDIDIIFLDGSARVVAMHQMVMEEPQGEDETFEEYEARLKRYNSRFPSQFVIELQGGMLDQITVAQGDRIELDVAGLKSRAR